MLSYTPNSDSVAVWKLTVCYWALLTAQCQWAPVWYSTMQYSTI